MKTREPFTEFLHGVPSDMKRKPDLYATMTKGGETRIYGPLTAREWGKLVDEERAAGWELTETKG